MAQTITKKLATALNNVNTLRTGLQAGTVQLVEVQKKMSRGGRVQEPPRFALVTTGGSILAIVITKPVNDDSSARYTILPPASDAA